MSYKLFKYNNLRNRKAFSAFGAPTLNNSATCFCAHSCKKTMSSLAASVVRLECAFHELLSTPALLPNQHGTQASVKLSTNRARHLFLSRLFLPRIVEIRLVFTEQMLLLCLLPLLIASNKCCVLQSPACSYWNSPWPYGGFPQLWKKLWKK